MEPVEPFPSLWACLCHPQTLAEGVGKGEEGGSCPPAHCLVSQEGRRSSLPRARSEGTDTRGQARNLLRVRPPCQLHPVLGFGMKALGVSFLINEETS